MENVQNATHHHANVNAANVAAHQKVVHAHKVNVAVQHRNASVKNLPHS